MQKHRDPETLMALLVISIAKDNEDAFDLFIANP